MIPDRLRTWPADLGAALRLPGTYSPATCCRCATRRILVGGRSTCERDLPVPCARRSRARRELARAVLADYASNAWRPSSFALSTKTWPTGRVCRRGSTACRSSRRPGECSPKGRNSPAWKSRGGPQRFAKWLSANGRASARPSRHSIASPARALSARATSSMPGLASSPIGAPPLASRGATQEARWRRALGLARPSRRPARGPCPIAPDPSRGARQELLDIAASAAGV